MVELSACYFCGTPDEVEAVPIIPPGVGPDAVERDWDRDRGTVTLCAACADKLERVIVRVVRSIEMTDGSERKVASDSSGDHDRRQHPGSPSSGPVSFDPSPSTVEGPEPTAPSEPISTDGDETDPSPSGSSSPADGSNPDDGAAPGEDGRRPLVVDDIPIDVSPTTVNRIVRLLQNRSFPIDRHDFLEIAAGAYEIDPAEVEAVIAMAVDRGLLVERGSMLDRPSAPPETGDTDT